MHLAQWRRPISVMVVICAALAATMALAFPVTAQTPDGVTAPGSGGTRVGNTIVYNNGTVVLELAPTAPQATAAATTTRCPAGWFCIFEHANFGGRMLRFRECCRVQNLTNYGFNDQMSSWHNRLRTDVYWYYDINGRGTRRCAESGAQVSYVGAADNDEASSINITNSDTRC
jgi:hypothetical protein